MSYVLNNRTFGYDNITPGNPKGQELVIAGGNAPPARATNNISSGNPEPKNLERSATGTLAYGLENP